MEGRVGGVVLVAHKTAVRTGGGVVTVKAAAPGAHPKRALAVDGQRHCAVIAQRGRVVGVVEIVGEQAAGRVEAFQPAQGAQPEDALVNFLDCVNEIVAQAGWIGGIMGQGGEFAGEAVQA